MRVADQVNNMRRILMALLCLGASLALPPSAAHAAVATDMVFTGDGASTLLPTGSGPDLSIQTMVASPAGLDVGNTAFGDWHIEFAAPTGADLTVGTFADTGDVATRSSGQFGLSVRNGTPVCTTSTGQVIIEEVEFDGDGALLHFLARFEYHCNGEAAGVYGVVAYDTTLPYRISSYAPPADFGTVEIGAPPFIATVRVSNDGPARLDIESAVITGPDADRFEVDAYWCITAGVAAHDYCTIAVSYRPLVSGHDHVATLTIHSNGAFRDGTARGISFPLHAITANSAITPTSPHGEFTPVTPARILDTRNGTGAPIAKIGPASSIDVPVIGRGGVPGYGVSAVVVNVTAVKPTANTFVTLWPTGGTRPTASNLNPVAGKAVPNMAVVPLGSGGKISAYNSAGSTDLLLDVVGYYSSYSGPAGSRFHPIEPFRAVDTRNGTGAPKKTIGPGGSLRIDLRGRNGLLPTSGMTAVVLNVTAVKPTAGGFVTVFPGDVTRPTASNLNTSPGVTAPNLVTVRVPANGIVEFYNSAGSTHLLVDVVGYYDGVRNGEAGRFIPIEPVRSWDTREDNDPLAPDVTTSFQIAGFDGVPVDASAIAANITAVKPTGNGYLTVFPDDVCTLPVVSTLNFSVGQTVPNMAITKLADAGGCALGNGWIDIFNPVGYTHVLIDVAGYFT